MVPSLRPEELRRHGGRIHTRILPSGVPTSGQISENLRITDPYYIALGKIIAERYAGWLEMQVIGSSQLAVDPFVVVSIHEPVHYFSDEFHPETKFRSSFSFHQMFQVRCSKRMNEAGDPAGAGDHFHRWAGGCHEPY